MVESDLSIQLKRTFSRIFLLQNLDSSPINPHLSMTHVDESHSC